MLIEWLKAGLVAYQNRDEIGAALETGWSRIFGKKTVIAVTGMAGVGKTVLFDHLTGRAFKPEYQVPHQSRGQDDATVKAGRKRLKLIVVPGQDSRPRHVVTKDIFGKSAGVDGVIHVVANGLASTRTTDGVEVLTRGKVNTIARYRARKLKEEIEDLEDTCRLIRDNYDRKKKPPWVIVTVDKVDLYQGTLTDVRDYYSPRANNKFGRTLRALVNQVGARSIRWDDTVPVCSRLEEFRWGAEALAPQLTDAQRNAYLVQFLELLKSYCN